MVPNHDEDPEEDTEEQLAVGKDIMNYLPSLSKTKHSLQELKILKAGTKKGKTLSHVVSAEPERESRPVLAHWETLLRITRAAWAFRRLRVA